MAPVLSLALRGAFTHTINCRNRDVSKLYDHVLPTITPFVNNSVRHSVAGSKGTSWPCIDHVACWKER